jgi:phosphate transport system protein
MGTHTLKQFDEALEGLGQAVLTMASITRRNLALAMRGLLERSDEACNEAIADDADVNELDKSIDADALEIITRYQPVASDLRRTLSATKMSGDIERIADEATGIAKRARKMNKLSELAEVKLVEPIYQMADQLLQEAVVAFRDTDHDLAIKVRESDKDLNKAQKAFVKVLDKAMEEPGANVKALVHLLFVTRALERIGDHAANIAEDVAFIASGQDIRYGGK